tara:strand:- start:26384 stop:27085 length:702 start_codon:yes stop_codon:yes gene_type:complete
MKKTQSKSTKKNKNYYFTQVHEDAIVAYVASDDQKERTELYVNYIQPAFDELVDKIVYTYKFNTLPNIDHLREECKIWLTTILDKFDQSKGSKAFSYYSVVTKNWFIHKIKKNSKRSRTEVQYDDMSKELEKKFVSNTESYESVREEAEFWSCFWKEVHSWDEENMKPNELKVYKAVKVLFNNIDDIEIFNKKAIYLYIRELTGLNTKQVVSSLNKLRARYRNFKTKWNQGGV